MVQGGPDGASRFAAWQNGPSGAWLTNRRRLGLAATPVSRLFIVRVCRTLIAYSSATPQETPADPFWCSRVSRRSEVGTVRTALHTRVVPPASSRRSSGGGAAIATSV
jgi:hypothetical protein